MDEHEAREILSRQIENARSRNYEDLIRLILEPVTHEVMGASGTWYQVEWNAVWDDKRTRHLRVLINIDDGTQEWTRRPLGEDFIMAPDGSFVGE
jgi:hypothetical protein